MPSSIMSGIIASFFDEFKKQALKCYPVCYPVGVFGFGGFLETLDLIGSPNWTRTSDPMINSHLLYQLSYRGTACCGWSSTQAAIL